MRYRDSCRKTIIKVWEDKEEMLLIELVYY